METIISAARLKPNGLHLGHYLGNFSNRKNDNIKFDIPYFFVIENVSPPNSLLLSNDSKITMDLIKDIYSISLYLNYDIKIVFLSDIISHSSLSYSLLNEFINVNHIRNIHPKRKILKHNSDSIKLSEYLFILNEVFYILSLNASRVFMNDDNLLFVNYARDVSRRINNKYGTIFTSPFLYTGIYPRLKGIDGERMSKSRNNAIFFSDNNDSISKKIDLLFSCRKCLKYVRLTKEGFYRHTGNEIPSDFLPFQYINIFSKSDRDNEIKNNFINSEIPINNLKKFTKDAVINFINEVNKNKANIDYSVLTKEMKESKDYALDIMDTKEDLIKLLL